MSATSGTGAPRTISGSAAAASASGTASRTTSAPASASARICASVAATSAVCVVVIDCTAIGAPPPIATAPTRICRVRRRSPRDALAPCPYPPIGVLGPKRFRRPALVLGHGRRPRKRSSGRGLLAALQLLVDDRLEGVERLGAGDEAAVDEEGGGSVHAHLVAGLLVLLDVRRLRPRVEALVELPAVDPGDLARRGLQVGDRELAVRGEELVVHLPVLPLIAGAVRGLGGLGRLLVHRERVVAVHELDLARVRREDVLHRRLGADAERALVVGELDDRHGRGGGPLRRADRLDGDLGRLVRREEDLDPHVLLELVVVLRERRLALLVLDEAGDLRLHLIERGELLAAGLGAVVEGADLVVARLGDLGRDLLVHELLAGDPLRLRLVVERPLAEHV